MVQQTSGRRIVPLALGVAMLVTVVAAGLAPTVGGVVAQSSCQYGDCSSGSASPFPWWIVAVVIAVFVVAALLGLLLFRRRPPSQPSPPEAWEPPAGASAAAAPTAGAPPPPPVAPAGTVAPAPRAAAPAYVETAEDVGQVPPAAAAGAGAGAAAGEAEPDIDSLMAELDKISGEILKKAPKQGQGGSEGAEGEDETQS